MYSKQMIKIFKFAQKSLFSKSRLLQKSFLPSKPNFHLSSAFSSVTHRYLLSSLICKRFTTSNSSNQEENQEIIVNEAEDLESTSTSVF